MVINPMTGIMVINPMTGIMVINAMTGIIVINQMTGIMVINPMTGIMVINPMTQKYVNNNKTKFSLTSNIFSRLCELSSFPSCRQIRHVVLPDTFALLCLSNAVYKHRDECRSHRLRACSMACLLYGGCGGWGWGVVSMYPPPPPPAVSARRWFLRDKMSSPSAEHVYRPWM